MTRRRSPTLTAAGAALLVLTLVTVSGADTASTPGVHGDDGRFSARAEGFPPQMRDLTDVRALPSVRSSTIDRTIRQVVDAALADPRVAGALAPGWTDHGAVPLTDGEDRWEVRLGQPSGDTLLVEVAGDPVGRDQDGAGSWTVAGTSTIDATTWQPPLTGDERRAAIDLARARLIADGHDRARWLTGFAIHGLQQDGTWPDHRLAYVTLAVSADHRPELTSWVDLSAQEVRMTSVQAGPQSPDPVARQADDEPDSQVGEDAVPLEDTIRWNGWAFSYELTHRVDGISLSSGTLRGVEVFKRLSMPAMTVFYTHPEDTPAEDRCGPYVDRLGLPELTPVEWFDDQTVVRREFTQDGVRWLELGILDTLGAYVLYQSWYLSEDGQIDGHAFAKGLQCEFFHEHYPFWRLDVDLDGADGDRITRVVDGQEQTLGAEFDLAATAADGHAWAVVDDTTGDRVDLQFDDGSWTVPGEVVPEVAYAQNMVYGRTTDDDDGQWRRPATLDVPFNDDESLIGSDIAVWYRGYLPHTAEEGPDLWHSTGVRMRFAITPRYQDRPGAAASGTGTPPR